MRTHILNGRSQKWIHQEEPVRDIIMNLLNDDGKTLDELCKQGSNLLGLPFRDGKPLILRNLNYLIVNERKTIIKKGIAYIKGQEPPRKKPIRSPNQKETS